MKYTQLKTPQTLIKKVGIADNFFTRLVGLLAHNSLEENEALWIHRCHQVHTFFMHFPIGVIFLDDSLTVLDSQTLKPWRISKMHLRAKSVLEVPEDFIEKFKIKKGDRLEVVPC